MEQHTKVYPIELDWNDNGDLYIEQRVQPGYLDQLTGRVRIIVEEKDVMFLLEELHNHWHKEIWRKLEDLLEEENRES